MLSIRTHAVPDSINKERRSVVVSCGTGVLTLQRVYGHEPFEEQLSVDEAHVNLSRFNKGAAVITDHNLWQGVRGQVAVIERSWVENGHIMAEIRFSRRNEDVDEIWKDVEDGIFRNFSVGYIVHRFEDVTPEGNTRKRLLAVDWEPYELSLVVFPVDPDADTRSANSAEGKDPSAATTYPCEIVSSTQRGERSMAKKTTTTTPPVSNEGAAPATRSGDDGVTPQVAPVSPAPELAPVVPQVRAAAPPVTPTPSAQELRNEGARLERERITSIRSQCESCGLDSAFTEGLITRGGSLEESRPLIIDEVARVRSAGQPNGAVRVEVGTDERQHLRAALTNALNHRLDPETELIDSARQFCNRSLVDINREILGRQGHQVVGQGPDYIAQRSLHTTSDFAAAIADVAHNKLRSAYAESPRRWEPLAAKEDLPDFRPNNSVQVSALPVLKETPQGAVIKRTTLTDSKETWSLLTYSQIIGFSRQLFVNDALGAFSKVVVAQGRAVRRTENNIVWGLIISSVNGLKLGDGKAIFHADHNNTGSGAIAVASVSNGRLVMSQHKDIDGKTPVEISPSYLVVPSNRLTAAEQFLGPTNPTQDSEVNAFKDKLVIVSSNHLDTKASTGPDEWYLVANPRDVEGLKYGYLSGAPGPQFGTKQGWDTDGLEFKVYEDFGATFTDFRAWYRSTGVA